MTNKKSEMWSMLYRNCSTLIFHIFDMVIVSKAYKLNFFLNKKNHSIAKNLWHCQVFLGNIEHSNEKNVFNNFIIALCLTNNQTSKKIKQKSLFVLNFFIGPADLKPDTSKNSNWQIQL